MRSLKGLNCLDRVINKDTIVKFKCIYNIYMYRRKWEDYFGKMPEKCFYKQAVMMMKHF